MVRLKHRYILFELVDCTLTPEKKDLLNLIRQSLLFNFGTTGTGLLNASLHLKYYSPRTGKGILQADRAHFRMAWAAMTWMTLNGVGHGDSGREAGFVRALGISGTIKKAEERLVRRDKSELFLLE